MYRWPPLPNKERYIGLMTGTSMDALDGVLVDFSSSTPILQASLSQPLPPDLRGQLLALTTPGENELARMARADIELARLGAAVVQQLLLQTGLAPDTITAIGSHGQTIRHAPAANPPFTVQLGCPNTLAELSGITTVADFRRRDIAAGGQGAPLVPAFHASLYRTSETTRVVLNLGGIANITILPADAHVAVSGFDTGPANILLDGWISQQTGQQMDRDGAWGGSGRPIPSLLERMLSDPYFTAAPPKSTGREYFHLQWLHQQLAGEEHAPADIQATLHALTVESVARAIEAHAPACQQVLVCGGGAFNPLLMEGLKRRLTTSQVLCTDEAEPAISPRWMEAIAFAWLARQTMNRQSGNLPAVTGARHPVILGGIYPGR